MKIIDDGLVVDCNGVSRQTSETTGSSFISSLSPRRARIAVPYYELLEKVFKIELIVFNSCSSTPLFTLLSSPGDF
jgi:hypothetical protein